MSHEFVSGFDARYPMWHGLGTVRPKDGQPLTAKEALSYAGQDWQVVKEPQVRQGIPAPDLFWVVKEDTGQILGSVKSRYEVVQNTVLYDFLAPIVGADAAIYETGGVLRNNRVVWALAALKGQVDEIVPGDIINNYILVAMSHDGSLPILATATGVRVVCMNTMSMALSLAASGHQPWIAIRHSQNWESYMEVGRQVLGLSMKDRSMSSQIYQKLARTPITSADLKGFVKFLFPSSKDDEDGGKARKNVEEARLAIEERFGWSENNLPGMEGSAYSLFNAVTNYIDHARPMRKGGSRVFYSWFSGGNTLRMKALRFLAKKAGINAADSWSSPKEVDEEL